MDSMADWAAMTQAMHGGGSAWGGMGFIEDFDRPLWASALLLRCAHWAACITILCWL